MVWHTFSSVLGDLKQCGGNYRAQGQSTRPEEPEVLKAGGAVLGGCPVHQLECLWNAVSFLIWVRAEPRPKSILLLFEPRRTRLVPPVYRTCTRKRYSLLE